MAYTLDRYNKLGKGVAQFILDDEATTVKDDHNLTIKLNKPNSLFLGGLSKIYILNRRWFKRRPVQTTARAGSPTTVPGAAHSPWAAWSRTATSPSRDMTATGTSILAARRR